MTTHLISSTLKSTWHAGRFTLGSARLGVVDLAGVKSLLASGLVQPVLSRPALSQYRTRLHVRPAQSSYANVRVMPPAHRLHWQDGRVTLSRYREPPAVTPDLDMAEAVPRLRSARPRGGSTFPGAGQPADLEPAGPGLVAGGAPMVDVRRLIRSELWWNDKAAPVMAQVYLLLAIGPTDWPLSRTLLALGADTGRAGARLATTAPACSGTTTPTGFRC